jgi:hypothetical protein
MPRLDRPSFAYANHAIVRGLQSKPTTHIVEFADRSCGLSDIIGDPASPIGNTRGRGPAHAAVLPLHGLEEFPVRLGIFHLVEQEFDG